MTKREKKLINNFRQLSLCDQEMIDNMLSLKMKHKEASFMIIDIVTKNIIWVCPKTKEDTGWEHEEMEHETGLNFVHPEDIETTIALRPLYKENREIKAMFRAIRKDEVYIWVKANIFPCNESQKLYVMFRLIKQKQPKFYDDWEYIKIGKKKNNGIHS